MQEGKLEQSLTYLPGLVGKRFRLFCLKAFADGETYRHNKELEMIMSFLSNPENQWLWGAIQVLFVLIGFYLVNRQLRLARDQNSISHLNFFRDYWNSEAMLKARLRVVEDTNEERVDFNGAEDVLASFMEDIGAAVSVGQADRSHVWSYFSYHVEGYWMLLEPKVLFYREKTSDDNYFKDFEGLYRLTTRTSKSKGSPLMQPDYLVSFRKEEKVSVSFLLGK